MRKLRVIMLVLFMLVMVNGARALTIRDSGDFVSTIDQIEGDVDPVTLGDWTADLGDFAGQLTINGDGTFTVMTDTDAWDRWANFGEITSAGWTVETRLRVDVASTGTDKGVFDILTRDGSTLSPWIFIRADGIGSRGGGIHNLLDKDMTDDFHVIRIVADSAEGNTLWVDGVSIGGFGNDGNYPSAIFLGRNGGNTVDNGTTTIDYIRFDTTGGYAPVPEPATVFLLALGGFAAARRRRA